MVTFVAYALLGHALTAATAFAVVSLFQTIRSSFQFIPQVRKNAKLAFSTTILIHHTTILIHRAY